MDFLLSFRVVSDTENRFDCLFEDDPQISAAQ